MHHTPSNPARMHSHLLHNLKLHHQDMLGLRFGVHVGVPQCSLQCKLNGIPVGEGVLGVGHRLQFEQGMKAEFMEKEEKKQKKKDMNVYIYICMNSFLS